MRKDIVEDAERPLRDRADVPPCLGRDDIVDDENGGGYDREREDNDAPVARLVVDDLVPELGGRVDLKGVNLRALGDVDDPVVRFHRLLENGPLSDLPRHTLPHQKARRLGHVVIRWRAEDDVDPRGRRRHDGRQETVPRERERRYSVLNAVVGSVLAVVRGLIQDGGREGGAADVNVRDDEGHQACGDRHIVLNASPNRKSAFGLGDQVVADDADRAARWIL